MRDQEDKAEESGTLGGTSLEKDRHIITRARSERDEGGEPELFHRQVAWVSSVQVAFFSKNFPKSENFHTGKLLSPAASRSENFRVEDLLWIPELPAV